MCVDPFTITRLFILVTAFYTIPYQTDPYEMKVCATDNTRTSFYLEVDPVALKYPLTYTNGTIAGYDLYDVDLHLRSEYNLTIDNSSPIDTDFCYVKRDSGSSLPVRVTTPFTYYDQYWVPHDMSAFGSPAIMPTDLVTGVESCTINIPVKAV